MPTAIVTVSVPTKLKLIRCLPRDVDYFIEKLESTIKFFVGLEKGPGGDKESGDDDFVPFI